jgi:hypothetical protein
MPDGLTGRPGSRSVTTERIARALAVVLGFAAVGALAGVAWEALWEAPAGVVYQDQWFLDPAGPDVAFAGTALYVVLAVPAGLVLGALAGLLRRHEAVTLAAVVVGSLVAGWLMYAVGHALGPPDPRVLAAQEPDYSRVAADLVLAGPEDTTAPYRSTAAAAFPMGALAGLTLVYLSGLRPARHR